MNKKRLFKHLLCLLSLFGFLISCQTEEVVLKQFGKDIPVTKKQVRYLDSKQSRHISAKLATKFNKPFGKNDTNNFTVLSTNVGEIDLTKVLEITNEFGVTNYTYLVKPTSITLEKFYNIVYSTYDDKEKVVLYEYLMTEDFKNAYYSGQKLIAQFEGTLNSQIIVNSFPCPDPVNSDPQTPVFGGVENSPYPNDSNLPDTNPTTIISNPSGIGLNQGAIGNTGGSSGGGSTTGSCGVIFMVISCNGGGGHDGSYPDCKGTFKGATYAIDTCTGAMYQIYKNGTTKKGENSEESDGDMGDPCPPADGIGIIEPSSAFMSFIFSLPTDLKNWLTKPYPQGASDEIKDMIENYINSANADLAFAEEFLQNLKDSGLNLDLQKSLNSPANIDFSAIDQNTTEGQQFTWIYNKLMASNTFKQMFTETFQINDPRINVKFEITDDGIPTSANGICILESLNGKFYNTIKINKSMFGIYSNISIAKTILHECIHAYLNIKMINQNLGTTIAEINGLDLSQLLGTITVGFGGVPVANGTVSQHDFMFNHMIPVFTDVLLSLKDKLISPSHISQAEQSTWILSNNEIYNFNWPDLFYYLSLNGLHESSPFLNQYPSGSINYEKFYFMKELGSFSITKTIF
ncbi:SprT-like domain-containing protein [Flavobacterium filum]|uniref:SprT-like domain-containing protein n=1 Tax=Flavobacterium filum TaxID=370974 RepID=UPI000427AB91|nr:SprT-like domain-containing protein [Flavobacterium filum]